MPLHKTLLKNDFYKKLGEHTDEPPAQTISINSRKLIPGRKVTAVSKFDPISC